MGAIINLCDNCQFKKDTCAVLEEELLYNGDKVVDCWLYMNNGLTEVVGFLQY